MCIVKLSKERSPLELLGSIGSFRLNKGWGQYRVEKPAEIIMRHFNLCIARHVLLCNAESCRLLCLVPLQLWHDGLVQKSWSSRSWTMACALGMNLQFFQLQVLKLLKSQESTSFCPYKWSLRLWKALALFVPNLQFKLCVIRAPQTDVKRLCSSLFLSAIRPDMRRGFQPDAMLNAEMYCGFERQQKYIEIR